MLFIDGHEDIAHNMLAWGRDYGRSAHAIRQAERGSDLPASRGEATLGLADWLAGEVALIFATLFVQPARSKLVEGRAYHTPQEAHRQAMEQLDVYHRLSDEHPQFRLVMTARDLDEVLSTWRGVEAEDKDRDRDEAEGQDSRQVGLVVAMEGADPIVEPEQVELWYERGLRIVGLAWTRTHYAGGTYESGPLSDEGRRLLRAMAEFNLALDLSHCAELAFFQALDAYEGPVIASHSNPRRFVNTDRNLSDEMIYRLVEREGVVGIMLWNPTLKSGWRRGDPKVTLNKVVAAIDHVCQLAGSAQHAALGTDFDGGFGAQDIPAELDTIADVGKIGQALLDYGYTQPDVEAVMSGNWLRVLRQVLP